MPAHTRIGSTLELQRDETRMAQRAVDRRDKGSERKAIAERERRRRWTVLGARAPVAGAEHDRGEPEVFVRERGAAGEAHLDRRSAREMHAVQARGQRACIVRDDEIAGLEKIGEARARGMRNRAVPDR